MSTTDLMISRAHQRPRQVQRRATALVPVQAHQVQDHAHLPLQRGEPPGRVDGKAPRPLGCEAVGPLLALSNPALSGAHVTPDGHCQRERAVQARDLWPVVLTRTCVLSAVELSGDEAESFRMCTDASPTSVVGDGSGERDDAQASLSRGLGEHENA